MVTVAAVAVATLPEADAVGMVEAVGVVDVMEPVAAVREAEGSLEAASRASCKRSPRPRRCIVERACRFRHQQDEASRRCPYACTRS